MYDVTPQEAANLLEHHQARYAGNRRCLVAVGFIREHEHPCRTRTSRGGLLAAIGRGQQYTTSTHGRVDGFKRIFLEDLGTFNAATLDCVKVGHWRVISIEIQAIPAGGRQDEPCDVGDGEMGGGESIMNVGEVRDKLADLDRLLEIEIICPYEDPDGDTAERAYDIRSVEKHVDADTKGEYVCITCGDA